jgi:hypothetical protein
LTPSFETLLGDGVRERIPILDAFIGRTAATMGSLANFLAGSSGTSPYLRRTMVVVPPSRSAVDPCHRYLKPRRTEIENPSPTPSPAGLAWRWGTRLSAPFRNPRKSAGLKSTVLPGSCGRFLPRSAPAFLPSSDGGRMRSRPSGPDQDLLRQTTSRCRTDDPVSEVVPNRRTNFRSN